MKTPHEIEIYVRFSETDAHGHINNTSYFLYFEEARTKLFKAINLERNSDCSFILASITCDYINQAYADQTLIVSTNVIKIGTKSFTVRHTITAADSGITIAKADATNVCYNYTEHRTIPIPKALRLRLENHFVTPVKY
ncbi:acyl-CoA thioesterase [Cytobacillus depressus]|uniref:Acyl-CoA thioesterase n=1 Tax=Cytobacillus depressus TaxID=1602942 RepID=A0A6L3VGC5_9BACI|nr:thioesterase family protein [Cytobacillus depressus]KAB2338584.1 acyl-CoA thioesterase [Cytobacillus depressus]